MCWRLVMKNSTKDIIGEITIGLPKCTECECDLADTAAIFWNKEQTKIIEQRAYCSNRSCDYVLVTKCE